MAQIFDNSDDKRMISGQHANGIVENFALTPFLCLTGLRKIESAPKRNKPTCADCPGKGQSTPLRLNIFGALENESI